MNVTDESARSTSSDPSASAKGGERLLPRERLRAVLPRRMGVVGRVTAALGAAVESPDRGPRPPPASGSWTPVSPAQLSRRTRTPVVARIRRRWRGTAYESRLDHLIQSPQLHRCMTIAVMSPKGGVGKTTVSALLGGLLAMLRRDRIVAVDTNPDFGTLGRALTPGHEVYVDDLLEVLDSPELTSTALDANLGRGLHGLMVLPAPTDPARMALLDQAAYRRVVRRLQDLVGVIVLDCGTGMHDPASLAALDAADQLLLVTDGDPATASLVAEAARSLEDRNLATWLVVNRLSRSRSRLDIASLEAHVPFARGLAVLPAEPAVADAVAAGTFDWREASEGWRLAVRQLAVALTADWVTVGAARA